VPEQMNERALVLAAKESQASARAALIEAFTPLISRAARDHGGAAGVSRAELIEEGVAGMCRALERYDPGSSTSFWTYASWWVREAMQRLVSERRRPVELSGRMARQLVCLRHARRVCVEEHGHEPTMDELAHEMGIDRAHVERLVAVVRLQ